MTTNRLFGRSAGVIMVIIVVRAKSYNYNSCGAKFYILTPALLKLIEYTLEATPSAARRDDYG